MSVYLLKNIGTNLSFRADNQYTELEARVLDMALILHMEHGGGNNSTFKMCIRDRRYT